MKARLLGLLLLVCTLPAYSQYAFINATLADGSGNTIPQGFLHFELYNCGYNFPTVAGNAFTVVKTSFDIRPTPPTNSVIGQVVANDSILCGGVKSTQWRVTIMKDQNTPLEPTQQYFIAANSTWTPGSQPAVQPPSPGFIQVFQNPVQTQTIAQPTGTSLIITGILDLTNATVIGFNSGAGTGTVTSVALSVPSWLTVAGSPVVTSGVLAVSAATGQNPHQVIGTGSTTSFGPVTLTTADLPFTYSGNQFQLATTVGSFTAGHTVVSDSNGNLIDSGTTGGSGTVTSFSAGNLSPLFTTSVATATSTPALTFSLSNANAHTWYGNNTGSTAAPGFQTIGTGDLPFTYSGSTTKLATASGSTTNGHCASWDASGNLVDSGISGCGGTASGTVTSVALSAPAYFTVTGSPVLTAGTLAFTGASSLTTHQVLGTGTTGTLGMLTLTTADLPFTYSGNTTKLGTVSGSLTTGHTIISDASGNLVDSGTTASGGTVTSVAASFTGGLVAIGGSPVTTTGTLAFTVAGTSGGIPYFSSSSTWATSAALTANLPVIGGGAGVAPSVGSVTGNTTKFATSTGALTNGHCASWDSNGNIVDFGSACGGGGGGGTVTNVGLAAPTGFTVTGSPVIASGTLTFAMPSGWATGALLLGNGANSVATLALGANGTFLQSNGTTAVWGTAGTVTSVAETFTGGLISVAGSPITSTGTLALTVAGTSGGIPYFSSATTWATSGVLTANRPVIGGGAGVAPSVGTVTGNTTVFATSTGTRTNGHCASWDANGNIVDSGTVGCGGSGITSVGFAAPTGFTVTGSPVTSAGTLTLAMPTGWTTGDLLLGTGANAVGRLGIGANGTVLTSNGTTAVWSTGASVSSVGLAMPTQFTVTGSPVTSAGTLNVAWAAQSAHLFFGTGSTGSSTPSFTSIKVADLPFTYTGNTMVVATSTGTLTNGHCVSIDANGNFVDSGVLGCGGGGGGGGGPTGPAGGDLSGTYPNPTVVSAAGNFVVHGTVTAVQFIGTGPLVIQTVPSTGLPTPISGQSLIAVGPSSSGALFYPSYFGNAFLGPFVAEPSSLCTTGQILQKGSSAGNWTCASAGGSGTVTSVGLSVNSGSSSGIFAITGTPVTASGTLNFNLSGTSGGIPYFSSSTVLSSSAALTAHGVVVGEGAGNAPVATAAGTNGQLLSSAGGSADPAYRDFYHLYQLPAGNNQGGTANMGWSTPASNACTSAAKSGTNVQTATWVCTSAQSTQAWVYLSQNWDTGVNPYVRFWLFSTDTTNTHTVIPTVAVACSKGDGTASYDQAFQTAQSGSTWTIGASAVSNGPFTGSSVQLNSTSMTNCVAGSIMYLKFSFSGSGTATDFELAGVGITVPELNVAGAQ